MLEIRKISKRFGGVKALDRCSFTIKRGRITALVGPNGAGKTTLLDVISGLVVPDKGSIHYNLPPTTYNLVGLGPHQITRLGISRTWQQVRLFKYLTIADHLFMAEHDSDTKLLRNLVGNTSADREKYEQVVYQFGIDRPIDTPVTDLSYGQRKLLQLAMVTLQPHKLLLLDEPVAGVNRVIQQTIEQLLLDLKKAGETVVIIEHDMEFVRRLADEVVVMDAGRVLVEGKPEKVLQDKRVLEAYLGE